MVSRPVSGVLSAFANEGWVAIHLSDLPRECLFTRRAGRLPCLILLRVGFTEPPWLPKMLVRSYRTVSPLPVLGCPSHRRSVFCGTVLHVTATHIS
jgi:hypothetical protein